MSTPTKKLPHLEGLRGLAAVMVVLCHILSAGFYTHREATGEALSTLAGPAAGNLGEALISVLFDGTLAVYIFWVLSGYVVSIKLLRNTGMERKRLFLSSVTKRYPRLMIPVLASVMVAWGLHQMGMIHSQELAGILEADGEGAWLERQYGFQPSFMDAIINGTWEAFFAHDVLTSYNSSLWTMQPELLGSILCFCFALLARPGWLKFILWWAICLVGLLLREYWLACFMAGILLSSWDHSPMEPEMIGRVKSRLSGSLQVRLQGWAGLALLTVLLITCGWFNQMQILKTLVAISTVYMVHVHAGLRRWFSSTPLLWLGRISFGLYLMHVPVICSLGCWIWLESGTHSAGVLWVGGLASLAVSVISGFLLYRWVDLPSVRLSSRIGRWAGGLLPESEKVKMAEKELEG